MLSQKIKEVAELSKIAPIVVSGVPSKLFDDAVVIDASISSKELGIVNTKDGPKYPEWFLKLKSSNIKFLVIDGIDKLAEYDQGKFYEILKYRQITNVDLPKKIGIIVTAKDVFDVADSIKNLCMIKEL